jgi:hypothetical protein
VHQNIQWNPQTGHKSCKDSFRPPALFKQRIALGVYLRCTSNLLAQFGEPQSKLGTMILMCIQADNSFLFHPQHISIHDGRSGHSALGPWPQQQFLGGIFRRQWEHSNVILAGSKEMPGTPVGAIY